MFNSDKPNLKFNKVFIIVLLFHYTLYNLAINDQYNIGIELHQLHFKLSLIPGKQ